MEDAKKHKILVVDDQIGIVSFLHDFFVQKDYDVLQATNAKKAIQLVKKEQPALVLLDIKLGWGADGLHVLREIKKDMPDVRVIMMTSIIDEDVMNEAMSSGADDYITKPFSLEYLEKSVLLKILNMEIKRLGKGSDEIQP